MSEEESGDDKPHEASARKLEQARERGEIARSPDVLTAVAYAGLLLASFGFGAAAIKDAGRAGMALLGQADRLATALTREATPETRGILMAMVWPFWPWFLIPGAMVLGILIATRTLIFSSEKLAFRMDRISPVATARQKFGRAGLFEFGKGFVKLVIVSSLLFWFLKRNATDILGTQRLDAGISSAFMIQLVLNFVLLVFAVALVIGLVDYLWQHAQHAHRNRMTRKEMMDEYRESEGDPHMKAERRARALEIATNRMLLDVAKANVVIVNPTHFAVALKWNRSDRSAPVCVAKGADEIAARIRERAAEAGVPVHSDPPTARTLFATVEIGDEIKREQYRAVAAAIRFAEAMRRRAKARR
jgi:flagellar biosynthetic protein FlhB